MRHGSGRLACLVGGALTGVVIVAVAAARLGRGEVDGANLAIVVTPTLRSALGGAVGGAVCGFLMWALWKPRHRIRKASVLFAALNCAAWLTFLVVNVRVSDGGASVLEYRAQLDRDTALGRPNGMTLISDTPRLLAGRQLTWVNLSQKPLGVFAGPAVVFVDGQIVPARYQQTGATVAESDLIAVVAFVMSMAWWVTAGSMVATLPSLKNRRARRAANVSRG